MKNSSSLKKYGYVWVTFFLFLFSILGHWLLAWYAYVDEQEAHQQAIEIMPYVVETARDTFENWQSEFLQLIWQVAGLSFLWYVGSPQSKEGDDRKEEKLDKILRALKKKDGEKYIAALEKKYPRA